MADDHQADATSPPPQTPLIARSPRYQDVYANSVRVRISPIDCSIVFGSAIEIPGAPPGIVQEEVTVTMSLPFAKVLLLHLGKTVGAIEKELGNIKVPAKSLPTDIIEENVSRMLKDNPLADSPVIPSSTESVASSKRSRR
jgi:hypothetical protein